MTTRHLLFRQLRQRSFVTAGRPSSSSSSSRILRGHNKQQHGRFVTNNNNNRSYSSSSYSYAPASSSSSSSSTSRIGDTMMEERRSRRQRGGSHQHQVVGEQAIELESALKNSSPLHFPASLLSSSSFRINSHADLSSILTEWFAKIPKGFENFYPKTGGPSNKQDDDDDDNKDSNNDNKDADTETKDSEKSTEGSSSSSSSSSSSQHHASFKSKNENTNDDKKWDSSGGGGVPPDGGDPPTITALLAMLLLVMGARRLLEGSENGGGTGGSNGKEITFVEFRNQLLHTGEVDKIVVVNNNMARVILHPGSKGIQSNSTNGVLPTSSSPGLIGRQSSSSNGGGDADSTVMEFDKPTDSSSSSVGGSGGGLTSTLSSSSSDNNKTPVYHFYIGSIESFEEKLTQAQSHIHPRDWIPVQYVSEVNLLVEFIKATPMLAMLAMLAYWSRGFMGAGGMGGAGGGAGGPGGIFQIGKSNAKKINPESVKVNFGDVAGCEQAKLEIMEFVDFLKDSSRFTKLGAKIPKGALLCGPPGTGKTLLAKAVAGEAGVPFYSISGSDFIEMFVGVGPSRVRDLFKEARANSPCIVFIDEIDAVGRQRGKGGFSGGNDERENTLNQLLVEMDGFTTTTGIVVLAGTNRVDILDQALTRPGRFDRQVQVDRPDLMGRKDIFNVHLKGITLEGDPDEFAGRLAGLTPGFAGADIANLCNEAAIVAARRAADFVTIDDFEKATDRIIGGLESNKIMSDEERQIVAHHEAGHAVAGWFLEHADPLLKVTIIPRSSGALGYAQYLPKEVFLRTQEQIMDIVCMALAGRAAEEVFFGRVTTGASDDLKRVTQLVYSTIQTYGMNSKVGQLVYPQDNDGMPGDKPYSEATAEAMDEEARAIVDAAYARTVALIREKKDEVDQVAKLLIERETITHDDMVDLVGDRPFEGDNQYKEYVSAKYDRKAAEEEKEKEKSSEDNTAAEDDAEVTNNGGGLTPGLA